MNSQTNFMVPGEQFFFSKRKESRERAKEQCEMNSNREKKKTNENPYKSQREEVNDRWKEKIQFEKKLTAHEQTPTKM